MKQIPVSKATLSRLPAYLQYLRDPASGVGEHVSSAWIARALGLGEVQVRKDLAAVSGMGKPKVGYLTARLIGDLEHFLGYDRKSNAVLIGAGNMGRALLEYQGFDKYGLEIIGSFDSDRSKTEHDISGTEVLPMSALPVFCAEHKVRIGIITVPPDSAQEVCDQLVQSGITAIWNFAPITLNVPDTIAVQQENLALSLAYLNLQTTERSVTADVSER